MNFKLLKYSSRKRFALLIFVGEVSCNNGVSNSVGVLKYLIWMHGILGFTQSKVQAS